MAGIGGRPDADLVTMTEAPEDGGERRPRLSIEERAARRDRVMSTPGDRYRSLVHALRAGREVDLGRTRRVPLEWHPVFWRLLALAALGALLYVAVRVGFGWWRDQHVDTWSGPVAVQSGQRLASCSGVGDFSDDQYPNWLRFSGAVYGLTDGIRPVPNPAVGQTTYTESGDSLGSLRLLFDDDTPSGSVRDYVLVYIPPSKAARTYEKVPGCQ